MTYSMGNVFFYSYLILASLTASNAIFLLLCYTVTRRYLLLLSFVSEIMLTLFLSILAMLYSPQRVILQGFEEWILLLSITLATANSFISAYVATHSDHRVRSSVGRFFFWWVRPRRGKTNGNQS